VWRVASSVGSNQQEKAEQRVKEGELHAPRPVFLRQSGTRANKSFIPRRPHNVCVVCVCVSRGELGRLAEIARRRRDVLGVMLIGQAWPLDGSSEVNEGVPQSVATRKDGPAQEQLPNERLGQQIGHFTGDELRFKSGQPGFC
jgi:hypothetical protein